MIDKEKIKKIKAYNEMCKQRTLNESSNLAPPQEKVAIFVNGKFVIIPKEWAKTKS